MDQKTAAHGNEFRKHSYDLAVIGAGPAGSLTAALAATAGLKTALIEKERMPRDKIWRCSRPGRSFFRGRFVQHIHQCKNGCFSVDNC
ncbi:MAG: NAD(P)/FAD-dependent oxidoreductase [Bacillota bacterium]|nr:NAD(P)/FAD-dependent oxidoreductase [Bacillota bacterium]